MRTVLRRIEPVSLAKIYGALGALYGLFGGLIGGCVAATIGSQFGNGGAGVGLLAVVLYPIMGALFGFVGGFIGGVVYNFLADRVGGVEMEFDDFGEMDIL